MNDVEPGLYATKIYFPRIQSCKITSSKNSFKKMSEKVNVV
jgi:hypothetical protein